MGQAVIPIDGQGTGAGCVKRNAFKFGYGTVEHIILKADRAVIECLGGGVGAENGGQYGFEAAGGYFHGG